MVVALVVVTLVVLRRRQQRGNRTTSTRCRTTDPSGWGTAANVNGCTPTPALKRWRPSLRALALLVRGAMTTTMAVAVAVVMGC